MSEKGTGIMELLYGPTSPFARKVRVLAIETGQRDALTLVRGSPMDLDSGLDKVNPLVKVPALKLDDGKVLYDSAVICEYLDSLHNGAKVIPAVEGDRWQVLRRAILGGGLVEAFIIWRNEHRRPDAPNAQAMEARQKRKIDNGFAALDAELDSFKDAPVRIDSISIACNIGYVDLNAADWGWREAHPKLAAWYDAYCQRPAMQETFAAKS
jgi:glutathione S-transferase